jgi:hypothetical protein
LGRFDEDPRLDEDLALGEQPSRELASDSRT